MLKEEIKEFDTWSYGNDGIFFVIPYETWDPSIEIIVTSPYIADQEIAICVCPGPELVTLIYVVRIGFSILLIQI